MLRADLVNVRTRGRSPVARSADRRRQTDGGRGNNQLTDVPRVALASHVEDHALQPYLE